MKKIVCLMMLILMLMCSTIVFAGSDFEVPETILVKLVTKYKADHNEVNVERGVWRKYNPYNPYVEGQDENGAPGGGTANSLESLDDLFADDQEEVNVASPMDAVLNSDNTETAKPKTAAATTPQAQAAEDKRQAELIDLQKELEAKFDELFGSIDSDD